METHHNSNFMEEIPGQQNPEDPIPEQISEPIQESTPVLPSDPKSEIASSDPIVPREPSNEKENNEEKIEREQAENEPKEDPATPEEQAVSASSPEPYEPAIPSPRRPLTPEEAERINKYRKFKKVDGSTYRRVNQFLRKRTYITAREWAIARLCADFSTRGGAEMTFIGENLPELVPFMTDTYSPQAVNQARSSFKRKVRKSGATFFYGALCGFFTADELDDILFEASEVARFLLEVEETAIDLDDEIDIEDRITDVMRSVATAASMMKKVKEEQEAAEEEGDHTK